MRASIVLLIYRLYLPIALPLLWSCRLSQHATASPRAGGTEVTGNKAVYAPIFLSPKLEVIDTLSDRDIPIGDSGFARDYRLQLIAGDQISIELTSDFFDTVVVFMNDKGKTLGKNDDAPDGGSNSLLFTRIKESGIYIIRVQGLGETSSGQFKLKVNKLKPQ